MNFTSKELQDAVAAEYVLGNLGARAQRRFERALAGNAGLRAQVERWQRRLGALAPGEAVAPSDLVWARINRDLDRLATAPPPQSRRRDRRALRLWQSWSAVMTAAALVLAVLVLRDHAITPSPALAATSTSGTPQSVRYVAASDAHPDYSGYAITLRLPQESSARWRVLLSQDARLLRVESVGHAALDQKEDYELWWVDDDNQIVSVGLLPRNGGWEVALPRQVQMNDFSRLVVTREPAFGSPADGPTGPVLMNTSLRGPS